MNDHDGLGGLAGLIVDGGEIGQRGFGDHAKAGTKAEGVLQAARDDAIGDADVDDIRQLIARRGLAWWRGRC